MTESRDLHPPLEELERLVDDVGDDIVHAHVASCTACRTTIDDMRRVTAALALSSEPPDGLLDAISERRRANDRVILSVGDDTEAERAQRAADALATQPPDDLLARVAARAITGEHVVLPRPESRWWRSYAGAAAGIAAVALLSVRTMRDAPLPSSSSSQPPVVAVTTRPAPPVVEPPRVVAAAPVRRAPVFRSVAPANSAPVAPVAPLSALPAVSSRGAGAARAVTLAAGAGARVLDSAQIAAVDDIAATLADSVVSPDGKVVIRFTDPSGEHTSESSALADRVEDRLLVRGVAPERIVRARVRSVNGLPANAPAVELAITRRTDPR